VPAALESPRATMGTFLHAMNDIKRGKSERIEDAVSTLDLSGVNPLVRRERGEDLAWMLLEVLDKTREVDLDRVPARKEGKPWVFERYGSGEVRIARVEDGRWLFDRETIAALPAILEEVATRQTQVSGAGNAEWLPLHIRLRQLLPGWLTERTVILQNWQWIGLLLIIALGVVVDRIAQALARLLMRRWLARFPQVASRIRDADRRLRPLGLMLMAAVWWIGILLLGLPEEVLLVLLVAVKLLASIAAVWTAWRLVDVVSALLAEKAATTDSRVDDVLVPMVSRTLKIFIAVGGVVFVADNLNIDVTGLLAGLGLGGLAFALAAKDLVQNFFGSITVLMDRTFTVGDWIIVDDVEGTVEHMGFRSTRIRTFYNSLVTIPNAATAATSRSSASPTTPRRRRSTPSAKGCARSCASTPTCARTTSRSGSTTWGPAPWRSSSTSSGRPPTGPPSCARLRERHRFLLDALRLADELGVEFAFPTQTVHLYQEEPSGEQDAPASLEDARNVARRIVRDSV